MEVEITSIAAFLGVGESEFIQQFTRLRADRQGLALMDQMDGSCIFLQGRDCRIQSVKPQQCRDFPNRWNFPGFENTCRAIPREVTDSEYARLSGKTGPTPSPGLDTQSLA